MQKRDKKIVQKKTLLLRIEININMKLTGRNTTNKINIRILLDPYKLIGKLKEVSGFFSLTLKIYFLNRNSFAQMLYKFVSNKIICSLDLIVVKVY